MKNPQITTIVFDIGGVLIDWNPVYLYEKIFEDSAEMKWFLQNVTTPDWNSKQDSGRSFGIAVSELKNEFPGYEKQIEAYFDRWFEMIGGAIKGSVSILSEIKKTGYPVYALTNWSAQTFPLVKEQYAFLDWFNGIVVSGAEKIAKPDPKIYQRLVDRYNLKHSSTLFIDDNQSNIEAAGIMGFQTIYFKAPDQLRASLIRQCIF